MAATAHTAEETAVSDYAAAVTFASLTVADRRGRHRPAPDRQGPGPRRGTHWILLDPLVDEPVSAIGRRARQVEVIRSG
jgi:hypothetical protein